MKPTFLMKSCSSLQLKSHQNQYNILEKEYHQLIETSYALYVVIKRTGK